MSHPFGTILNMSIRVPVADHAGTLVWAAELGRADERPDGLTCIGCDGDLILRAGERNQAHFAHKHADACTAPETALHKATCRVLADALTSAAADRRTFPIVSTCTPCRAARTGNLAAPGLDVTVDRQLADGIRPDLLGRVGDRELFVIEVVVTHAPEPAALDLYADHDLSVVVLRPTWETLERFAAGFHADLRATSPGQAGTYEIVSRCRFPRHVEPGPVTCPTCDRPARRLTAEVSTLRCWRRGCGADVRVLDLYDRTDAAAAMLAASCPDLPDLDQLAQELDVRLAWRHSKQAQGPYLMHLCPRCKATQGDNFLYTSGPTPSLDAPVVHLTACPDHLTVWDRRRWPTGSTVERDLPAGGARSVVGLVGEPPGLFAKTEPLVQMRTVPNGQIGHAVSRMFGGFG